MLLGPELEDKIVGAGGLGHELEDETVEAGGQGAETKQAPTEIVKDLRDKKAALSATIRARLST